MLLGFARPIASTTLRYSQGAEMCECPDVLKLQASATGHPKRSATSSLSSEFPNSYTAVASCEFIPFLDPFACLQGRYYFLLFLLPTFSSLLFLAMLSMQCVLNTSLLQKPSCPQLNVSRNTHRTSSSQMLS